MLESLQKHSNRGSNRLSDEIAAGWFQKSPANHLRQTPQASVPPRVMGFEIQTKPKIRMTRLDMSALQGLVPPVAPAAAPEPPPEQGDLLKGIVIYALSFYVTKTVLVGPKWFWSDQIDLDLTIMIWY